MDIIGTETSPFTRKVRIVALERNIPARFVLDSPFAAPSRVPRLNPLGKVPILLRDDGSVLVDSPCISAWLDAQGEGESLIPQREPERTDVLQWEAIADGIAEAAVLLRMESLRPESERSAAWIERQRAKVEGGMKWMNTGVDDPGLAAALFSHASIVIGCCYSYLQFRFGQDRWAERFASVASLCARLEQRPSFKATVLRG